MTSVLDPEGAHLAALRRLCDFRGRRVLELGCGEGRLTIPIARQAEHVFAFDTDADAVERALQSLPAELEERVTYRVASGKEIEIERHAFELALFSWSLWWVEPEDVVHVLRNLIEAVEPGGLILDLQVIRPNPVIEADGRSVCDIDGEPLFRTADTAAAALDAAIEEGALGEEARDDHDVREHFGSGAELIGAFAERKRDPPAAALPMLRPLGPCAVRERCRLRKLRVRRSVS